MGLTSYFRSAQEGLMPKYDRSVDRHEVQIPMSDYQFKVYEDYRRKERQTEKMSNKRGIVDINGTFKEPSSTYRIFSRLACNYVMPTPPGRPNPQDYKKLEIKRKARLTEIWLEHKYLNDKDKYDEELSKKLIELGQETLVEGITDTIYYKNLFVNTVKTYIKEYLKGDLTEMSIKEFFEKVGYGWFFNDRVTQPTKNELILLNAKLEEKDGENVDTKADIKADTKADTKKEKEEKEKEKEEKKVELHSDYSIPGETDIREWEGFGYLYLKPCHEECDENGNYCDCPGPVYDLKTKKKLGSYLGSPNGFSPDFDDPNWSD